MKHNNRWVVSILVIACLALSACAEDSSASDISEAPVHFEPIEGTDLSRIVLTERAAERLAIQTIPVREEEVARSRRVGGEIADLASASSTVSEVWVRVPLIESEFEVVDRTRPAFVFSLAGNPDSTGVAARPAGAPAGIDTRGALFYRVDGGDPGLMPGQRVLVELPLLGGGMKKIIPYAALFYDLHGETWAYTSPEPLQYLRQPISVDYIDGELAVLLEGPPVGTQVVTVGVAELWGAETGIGGGH
jgi:hypothetical protein